MLGFSCALGEQWKAPSCQWGLLQVTSVVVLVCFYLGLAIVRYHSSTVLQIIHSAGDNEDYLQQQAAISSGDGERSRIHICLAYDHEYLVGLIALVNSTILHCSRPHDLVFHLVSDDPPKRLARTQQILKEAFPSADMRFRRLYTDLVAPAKVWAAYRSADLSKPIVYARYILPALFGELDRLVYLDQDIIVTKDIAPLYEIDMEGHPLAAARLCRQGALFDHQMNMSQPELKRFDPNECSLNNGVLVYDMAAWRENNYTDELFAWTRLNNEKQLYKLGSQPPFNLVFYRNYKRLDKYWNLMDIAGLKVAHEPTTVAREDLMRSGVLHWNGALKPWMCEEGHYSEEWRTYFPSFRSMVQQVAEHDYNGRLCDEVVITDDAHLPIHEQRAQFTVVMTSHKRVDNLERIVNHLRRSDYVKEIFLVWNSQEPCPEAAAGLVRCFPQRHNYIHNRFSIWGEVTTEGVLQHDDDVMVSLKSMEEAFKIWRRHSDRILGFEPRVARCRNNDSVHASCSYSFQMADSYFNLVIGKMFFISNKYQEEFFRRPGLVDLTSRTPCEDLAMNYMVGEISRKPPLWFQANHAEVPSALYTGLSHSMDPAEWSRMRHGCVNELNRFFGGKTVLPNTTKYRLNKDGSFVIKLRIQAKESWCSDSQGGRPCGSLRPTPTLTISKQL